RRLASALAVPAAPREGEVKLFETAGGQELLSLRIQRVGSLVPSFSTDGTRLYAADVSAGTYFIWHTQPLTADDVRRRDAPFLVRSLFARTPHRNWVREQLRRLAPLDDGVRQEALALAESQPSDPVWLNNSARPLVRRPSPDGEAARKALVMAEEAAQQEPENGLFLTTLGIVAYRAGQYDRALATLVR